ncbi:MAG TPA: FxLYD domain-containing protein [Verrucomicrobiae bacterium]
MSGQTFHKILCSKCAGKIEFPAEYAGQTIPCPHCQTLVELKAPPADPTANTYEYPDPSTFTPEDVAKGHKARWNIIYAVAILIGINAIIGVAYLFRSGSSSGKALDGVQVMDWKLEPGEYRTFFLTGVVSNSTSKAIEKARIEFETLDNSGASSGKVSTSVSNLAPGASVEFSLQTSATQNVWDAKVVGVYQDKN